MIRFDRDIPLIKVAEAATYIDCELRPDGKGNIDIVPRDLVGNGTSNVRYLRKEANPQTKVDKQRDYYFKLLESAFDGDELAQKKLPGIFPLRVQV